MDIGFRPVCAPAYASYAESARGRWGVIYPSTERQRGVVVRHVSGNPAFASCCYPHSPTASHPAVAEQPRGQAGRTEPRNGAKVFSQGREPLGDADRARQAPQGRQRTSIVLSPLPGLASLGQSYPRGSRPWLITVAFPRLKNAARGLAAGPSPNRRPTPTVRRRMWVTARRQRAG